jgi:hypothetical protein
MGYERFLEKQKCRCGAAPGELHKTVGCDDEQCPLCGLPFSAVACEHADLVLEDRVADRRPWTGVPVMIQEAVDFGFFVRWDGPSDFPSRGVHGGSWVPCGKEHPDAMPSPNAVFERCRWSAVEQKFVLKKGS